MERPRVSYPGSVVGVRSASATDLAGLEAGGAHVDAPRGAVDRGADPLDVGVEPTTGGLLGPRAVVAEARLLGADVADGSHGHAPGSVEESGVTRTFASSGQPGKPS